MRHLVTGGAGFIGSHVCDMLVGRGESVICLDNLLTGHPRNIEHLMGRKNFRFEQRDVCESFNHDVDRVWHLACPASPVQYQRNAARTIKTNVVGTANALEAARNAGARLLLTSTSEVYGDPTEHPQRETYWGNVNPIGPRACYDEGKRCAEALVVSFARQYAVEVRIARLFNTYGPRMALDDGRVVSNFLVQALRGEPLTIYGGGRQTRSFAYIDDAIACLDALMERGPQATPVNIGNPEEYTMVELAAAVADLVGDTGLMHHPMPVDDPSRRRPDIARARELLGWEPTTRLRDGLEKTAAYFRRELGK